MALWVIRNGRIGFKKTERMYSVCLEFYIVQFKRIMLETNIYL